MPDRDAYIVDGSNVSRCPAWRSAYPELSDIERSERLEHVAFDWSGYAGHELILVFDGPGVTERSMGNAGMIMHSGRRDADSLIRDHAVELIQRRRSVAVVTDDRELAETIAGARRVHTSSFVADLLGTSSRAEAQIEGEHERGLERGSGGSSLDQHMSDSVRERLDRMRRGLE